MNDLDIPGLANELRSEPIQKFGMSGSFSLGTEILACSNQSATKELFPKTIHGYASDQRVVFIGQPSSQRQAIWGLTLWQRRQHRWHSRCDLLSLIQEIAPNMNMSGP